MAREGDPEGAHGFGPVALAPRGEVQRRPLLEEGLEGQLPRL
jgi:hypothetical protein